MISPELLRSMPGQRGFAEFLFGKDNGQGVNPGPLPRLIRLGSECDQGARVDATAQKNS